MVHRIYRLSISPERAPAVRRVVDFDGRSTLHDVHNVIQDVMELDDDHLYAFYLSGRYFHRPSEHSLSRDSPNNSGRSVLFRLGLSAGQQLAYVFDFGDEHRHAITVVSITEVEAPLAEPVVVESVGDAPSQYGNFDEDEDQPYELPAHLAEVVPLAEAVLVLSERLDTLYEEDEDEGEDEDELTEEDEGEESTEGDDAATSVDEPAVPREAIPSLLRELSKAALELAQALNNDEEALHELDEWSRERELLPRVLELPGALVGVGELESALAVAHAFTFVAPESCNADVAIILAESGKREEAVTQLEANVAQFPDSFLTVIKSGAALEALGTPEGAEAAYRRALILAEDESEHEAAFEQLTGLLEDMGRFEELNELLSPSTEVKPIIDAKPFIDAKPLAPVGRNDPCPCGSGKKYKKCHGA
jgi:tetratricopeptide (TPR) repeat protein